MIKVKQFIKIKDSNFGIPEIDKDINEWLENKKNIEVIDIKYQVSNNNVNELIVNICIAALVIYKEE